MIQHYSAPELCVIGVTVYEIAALRFVMSFLLKSRSVSSSPVMVAPPVYQSPTYHYQVSVGKLFSDHH